MPSLKCAHCNAPVVANPVARWFSKFLCPHCRKPLQFDRKTNYLGVAGSVFFILAGVSFIMARPPYATIAVSVGLAGWIVLGALSYVLRGIEKG